MAGMRGMVLAVVLLTVLIGLAGCSTSSSAPPPMPVATSTPTATPQPTPTATPQPVPTATPTDAPKYVKYSKPPTVCDNTFTVTGQLEKDAEVMAYGHTVPFMVESSSHLRYDPLTNSGGRWAVLPSTSSASALDLQYADTGQTAWDVRQMYASTYSINKAAQTFDIVAKAPSAVRESPSSYVFVVWGWQPGYGTGVLAQTRIAGC